MLTRRNALKSRVRRDNEAPARDALALEGLARLLGPSTPPGSSVELLELDTFAGVAARADRLRAEVGE